MAESSLTIQGLVDRLRGKLVHQPPGVSLDQVLNGISDLAFARSGSVAFFFSRAYQELLKSAAPSVLVTGPSFVQPLLASGLPLLKTTVILEVLNPYSELATLSEYFALEISPLERLYRSRQSEEQIWIHPTAVVDPSASLGRGAWVGPHAVIESGVKIGSGCVISAGCFIGSRAELGEGVLLHPRVTLYERVLIGARCRVHSGCVLGGDGFGYAPEEGRHHKIFHLGSVQIEADVEIGPNCTIDRGTLSHTIVGEGTKIDDQVHLGHNVQIGKNVVICGGSGLAGNAEVHEGAYLGGMVGVSNQVVVGKNAKVAAMTLVSKDVAEAEVVAGNPQRAHRTHFKVHAWLNQQMKK